ncbi:50S ribosomal protein L35 [Quillaja saponaria]|uniref:50S ribosomal protein L35 n=1 Tax=Quillaja saponaria TaxID=32244 RepID=A0AAD7L897_QUISA|nr:50S ribosomal protein L35 [Quillaja saponaria]
MLMQRWCSKLRNLAVQSGQTLAPLSSRRLLHTSPQCASPLQFASSKLSSRPLFNVSSAAHPSLALQSFRSYPFPSSLVQVRQVSSRERAKKRKPMTPVTSKLKKTKMKSYSSYKSRFRTMNDGLGTIRRWKEGKRHNAHLKSKKSKRRLRKPGTVPPAYAKVMKKLNFCG